MRNLAAILGSVSKSAGERLRRQKVLWIFLTAVLGLAVGLFLQHLTRLPSRAPSVSYLIHALHRQETPLHEFWQDIWICLPDWVTQRCDLLRPIPAFQVRASAAIELGSMGRSAERAVPDLARALFDPDRGVRSAALDAFRSLGPVASAASDALLAYFNDPANTPIVGFPDQRAQIADVLMLVAPANRSVINTLLTNATSHPDLIFRALLLATLGNAQHPPPALLNALQNALVSTNPPIRDAAIGAAGRLGPAGAELVPGLMNVYAQLSREATGPRRRYDSPPVPVMRTWSAAPPIAVAATTNVSPLAIKAWSGLLMTSTNPPVPVAAPYYFSSIEADPQYEQRQIIQALGQIGPGAKAAIPLLNREVTNSYAAVLARWQIDHDAAAGIADLRPFLHPSEPAQARCSVIGSLSRMGPDALPVITQLLDDNESTVRFNAVLALQHFGAAASAAVPKLQSMLQNDSKYYLRAAAAEALKHIAPARAPEWKAPLPQLPPVFSDAVALRPKQ